jgi:hypothetical protein
MLTTEEMKDQLVILAFGYHTKFLIRAEAAMTILCALSNENVQQLDTKYAVGKSTNILKPWGTEEIKIEMISPAEILLRQAAAHDPEST